MMKNLISGVAALGLIMSAGVALADDDLPEGLDGYRLTGETVNCVSTRRIDRTTALDDDNILFEMSGRKAYLNRLDSSCPRLGFEDSFMYRTSGSRLCSVDIITVLHDGDPGASCSLGVFEELEEIPEDDAE